MAEIVLTGLAANDPTPGDYVEVVLGAGPVSGGGAVYKALLMGGMLSTGSATPDTVLYGPDTPITMVSEADVIALFGSGSELHRKFRRFVAVNPTTPVYCIAVSEGGSAAAATGTITITGTATGAATLRIWVGDSFVDTGISTGDTPTVQAANAVININSRFWWPVVATNSAGVITLTSLQKGLRANFIRYFAQIKPGTSGVTVSPTASTLTSGGTVTDNNSTALATIVGQRFYYIASAAEDATNLGRLTTQVNSQALPTTGIRQRVFAGSQDTLANVITITTGLNSARAEIAWLAQSDMPPCELAANEAAVEALGEQTNKLNFAFYGDDATTSATWLVKAPLSGATPTRSQIEAALNAGVTPIGVLPGGRTYLVNRQTTRFLNGSVVDYRIRDPHKVWICDTYADQLIAKAAATMHGKSLAADPIGNEPLPGPTVITPRVVLASVNRLTNDFAEDDLLQNVTAIVAATQCQRSTVNTQRMTTLIPLQPIDILTQNAFSVQQVA